MTLHKIAKYVTILTVAATMAACTAKNGCLLVPGMAGVVVCGLGYMAEGAQKLQSMSTRNAKTEDEAKKDTPQNTESPFPQ